MLDIVLMNRRISPVFWMGSSSELYFGVSAACSPFLPNISIATFSQSIASVIEELFSWSSDNFNQ